MADAFHYYVEWDPASHKARTETVRARLMKDECDFSKGERGRFSRKGAKPLRT